MRGRLGAMLAIVVLQASCGFADESVGLECQRTPADGSELREGEDPLAPGGPLAGRDVTGMTAAAVGRTAEAAGFGVTHRYHYEVGAQPETGSAGYSECWCVPPPGGRVIGAGYDAIGRVIVMVDSGLAFDATRQQPRLGWGCEA